MGIKSNATKCILIAIILVHGFSTARSSVEEGRRIDISLQMNVKGLTQFGSALVLSGIVSAAADGTAGICFNPV